MSQIKTHIYFRADASKEIGYGHFVRTLALADMLGDGFERTFATVNPTQYQIDQINSVCDNFIELGQDHFDAFLSLLQEGDIVVLDNYFFTTDYQIAIKAKGCKLVCIDDMHDKHYVADVVINHGINDKSLFSVEPYTLLCLGLDWALVRRPFLEAIPRAEREIGHCVVCFGGSDWNNLTEKVCRILADKSEVVQITAIIGDAYAHVESLKGIGKVEIFKNLSAQAMADLFCKVEFAVLPTSGVCIEALLCQCPVFGGYYIDNQKDCFDNLVACHKITGLGNFAQLNNIDTHNIVQTKQSLSSASKYFNVFTSLACMNFECGKYKFINYTDVAIEYQEEIYNARNDFNVRKHMTNDQPFEFSQHLSFVESLKMSDNKIYWAVYKKNVYLGSVYINPFNSTTMICDWGLYLSPNNIGTGVGLEIEYYFLYYLFKSLGIKEVNASVKITNTETLKLQQSFSFQLIHQDANYYYIKITRDGWEKTPSTLQEFKTKLFQL